MTTGKVVPLRPVDLPGLGMASVASTGRRIDGSRNEVWLCQAYDATGQSLVLYVKPKLSPRSLLVEALAAQIGQCIGLPCPDPYIVTVNPLYVGGTRGKQIVAFGSAQVGSRGLARPIHDVDSMLDSLQRFGLGPAACAFDEWIANPVRGPGDVMFDPEAGAVFIDHEAAMDPLTAPDAAVTNWIAARILERTAPGKRMELLKAIRTRAAAAHKAQLGQVPSVVQIARDGVAIYRSLLEFLAERLSHLDRLLSLRILPEQGYLTESPIQDATDRATDI
jgi:hypothetical protein